MSQRHKSPGRSFTRWSVRPFGKPAGKPYTPHYPQAGDPAASHAASQRLHRPQRGVPTRPLPPEESVEFSVLEVFPLSTVHLDCDSCGQPATYVLTEIGVHARSRGHFCDICIIAAVHHIESAKGDHHAL